MKSLTLAAIVLLTTFAQAQQPTADTIYIHGNILTGTHLRPNDPSPTPEKVAALAIADGKILAAGSDSTILKLKTPKTKVIDLHGAFAMPGFNDAHTHMADAGQQKLSINLDGVTSLAEMQQRIRTYAAKAKPGIWLVGGGWDHTLWPGAKLPTRADIDPITAGHPCILSRVDGHIALANSAALTAANITADTPDPTGARIDRDSTGTPTGILRESAATNLVFNKIPPPSLEERREALNVAINDALAHGVTSVQDNSEWEDFLALEELEHSGRLHLRVAEWLAFDQPLPVLEQRRASHPADDPLLHLTMLKGFMDGSLGSRTAALDEPYSDDPNNSGLPRYDQSKLTQLASERAAAGFQLGFHAIGDRANDMALNAFGAADQVALDPCRRALGAGMPVESATSCRPGAPPGDVGPADLRFRVEHAQVLLPGDFDRFASEGVIASMQPSHLLTDMKWATDRLGPERAKYAYAWRSFLNHHVTLAFGTDYPVESIDPFRGLYSAITRQNEAETMTFQPQEKISLNEAIYAYTQASAFAEFREHEKGRLEPGYLADIIVLDRDITTASPQQLLRTKVLRTVVQGDTVYAAYSNQAAKQSVGASN
ncbi:amidohydrolase [Tunturiibacter lichenicola]|uniref:amidohydrolase n=1 Tax=Tunturiibacter lichenicola TaxID=2051959 RepID=UPI0021B31C2F|nr:amidohydrolase [Edaphobacter lichenicola]